MGGAYPNESERNSEGPESMRLRTFTIFMFYSTVMADASNASSVPEEVFSSVVKVIAVI